MKKLVFVPFFVLLSGCATILNSDYQNINVGSSNDTKVAGTIDGVPFSGPGIVAVKRAKADKIMLVSSPACQKQVLLASNVDPKFFINILSGGTFGSATDYMTEKMWKYQDSVIVSCK